MKADTTPTTDEKAKFQINSSYQGFSDRQKSVFDQLNLVEHNTRNVLSTNTLVDVDESVDTGVDEEDVIRTSFSRNLAKVKHLRGKESIFKRPQARPPRSLTKRTVPDYHIHPHKWTRYSLDVPNEDMSERANTSAAMSFLKELESRKQFNDNMEEEEMPQKIVFKKFAKQTVIGETTSAPVVFRNSKVVMPEYVVGDKMERKRKSKRKIEDCGTSKEIKLDHLHEDDED